MAKIKNKITVEKKTSGIKAKVKPSRQRGSVKQMIKDAWWDKHYEELIEYVSNETELHDILKKRGLDENSIAAELDGTHKHIAITFLNLFTIEELDEMIGNERGKMGKHTDLIKKIDAEIKKHRADENYDEYGEEANKIFEQFDKEVFVIDNDDDARYYLLKATPIEAMEYLRDRIKGKRATGGTVSQKKAEKILHEGKVRGHELTDKQRRFFGARASGYPVRKEEGGYAGGGLMNIGNASPNDFEFWNSGKEHRIKALEKFGYSLKYADMKWKDLPTGMKRNIKNEMIDTILKLRIENNITDAFGEDQIKNIVKIVQGIKDSTTGEIYGWASGGNIDKLGVQLTNGKWIVFHNDTGDITLSKKPYKTKSEFQKDLGSDDSTVFDFYLPGLEENEEFSNVQKAIDGIKNNKFVSTYAQGGRLHRIKIKGKYYVDDATPPSKDRDKALTYKSLRGAKEDAEVIKEQWGLENNDVRVLSKGGKIWEELKVGQHVKFRPDAWTNVENVAVPLDGLTGVVTESNKKEIRIKLDEEHPSVSGEDYENTLVWDADYEDLNNLKNLLEPFMASGGKISSGDTEKIINLIELGRFNEAMKKYNITEYQASLVDSMLVDGEDAEEIRKQLNSGKIYKYHNKLIPTNIIDSIINKHKKGATIDELMEKFPDITSSKLKSIIKVKKDFPNSDTEIIYYIVNWGALEPYVKIAVNKNFPQVKRYLRTMASGGIMASGGKIEKVATAEGHDYYIGRDESGKRFYNIVPEGSPAPTSGYFLRGRIVREAGVSDRFGDDAMAGGGKTESTPLYLAYWDDTFFTPGSKTVSMKAFSEDAGYSDEDREAIKNLSVGETWKSPDYGNAHTVTRIAATAVEIGKKTPSPQEMGGGTKDPFYNYETGKYKMGMIKKRMDQLSPEELEKHREYLNDFVERWDAEEVDSDFQMKMQLEYNKYTTKHNLPQMSADELVSMLYGDEDDMATGGKVGGRGFFGLKKGEKIESVDDISVGDIILAHSSQFNADNTIKIVEKKSFGRITQVSGIYWNPITNTRIGNEEFGVDPKIGQNEYYKPKSKESMATGGFLDSTKNFFGKAKEHATRAYEKTKPHLQSAYEKSKELAGKGYAKGKQALSEKQKELVLDYLKSVQNDSSLDKNDKDIILDARHIVAEIGTDEVNPRDLVKGKKYNYVDQPGEKIKYKSFSNGKYFFKDRHDKLLALTASEVRKSVVEQKKKYASGGEIRYEEGGLIGKKIVFNQEITSEGVFVDKHDYIETTGKIIDKGIKKGETIYIIEEDATGELYTLELDQFFEAFSPDNGIIVTNEIADKHNPEEKEESELKQEEEKEEATMESGGTIQKVNIKTPHGTVYATLQKYQGDKVITNKGVFSKEDVLKEFTVPKQHFMNKGGNVNTTETMESLEEKILVLEEAMNGYATPEDIKAKHKVQIDKYKKQLEEHKHQAKMKKLTRQSSDDKHLHIDIDKKLKKKMRSAIRAANIPYRSKSTDGVFRVFVSNQHQLDTIYGIYNEKRKKFGLDEVKKEEVTDVVKKRSPKSFLRPIKKSSGIKSKIVVEKKNSLVKYEKKSSGIKGKLED